MGITEFHSRKPALLPTLPTLPLCLCMAFGAAHLQDVQHRQIVLRPARRDVERLLQRRGVPGKLLRYHQNRRTGLRPLGYVQQLRNPPQVVELRRHVDRHAVSRRKVLVGKARRIAEAEALGEQRHMQLPGAQPEAHTERAHCDLWRLISQQNSEDATEAEPQKRGKQQTQHSRRTEQRHQVQHCAGAREPQLEGRERRSHPPVAFSSSLETKRLCYRWHNATETDVPKAPELLSCAALREL
eukprot:scaffold6888_cov198-Pinguiococcus_pyrenoidosus.AAC.1